MGINLRDHVHNVDDLFTLEEAEQLFTDFHYLYFYTFVAVRVVN